MTDTDVKPLARMEYREVTRYRSAAVAATKLGLGPLGELASREINAWADFGYRHHDIGLINQVVAWVEQLVAWAETEHQRQEREAAAEHARAVAETVAPQRLHSAPAAPLSATAYLLDRGSSPHGASQAQQSASPVESTPAFPPCVGCEHTAWAHGNQSGNPGPTDLCHAAVPSTGPEEFACGCVGYQATVSEVHR